MIPIKQCNRVANISILWSIKSTNFDSYLKVSHIKTDNTHKLVTKNCNVSMQFLLLNSICLVSLSLQWHIYILLIYLTCIAICKPQCFQMTGSPHLWVWCRCVPRRSICCHIWRIYESVCQCTATVRTLNLCLSIIVIHQITVCSCLYLCRQYLYSHDCNRKTRNWICLCRARKELTGSYMWSVWGPMSPKCAHLILTSQTTWSSHLRLTDFIRWINFLFL